MSLIEQTQEQQELRLTPQLLQSMKILQMNCQELSEFVSKAAEENPAIEEIDAPFSEEYLELQKRVSWINAGSPSWAKSDDEEVLLLLKTTDKAADSLEFFLKSQLSGLELTKQCRALCTYIVSLLNDDGYFLPDDYEHLVDLNVPMTLLDSALKTVQRLEPAGVAARDLRECLRLQLSRRGCSLPLVFSIVDKHLPELAEKRYAYIAKSLKTSIAAVHEAEKLIAELDPRPGSCLTQEESTKFISPDVFVIEGEQGLEVVLNDFYIPKICLSNYYLKLYKTTDDEETKNFLREKMQNARWVISTVARRGDTLRRCTSMICELQNDFFTGKTNELKPMTMSDLAQLLNLHISTVSRTISGKHVQCRQGCYPMRALFQRQVGCIAATEQSICLRIKELIETEDPQLPLTDIQLCELLSETGVMLARRTVAKYREKLRIPSSTQRKRYAK